MRIHLLKGIILFVITISSLQKANAIVFNMVTPNQKVTIIYGAKSPKLDSISANLLAADIKRITGYLPLVLTDLKKAKGNVIIIGNMESALIAGFSKKLNLQNLKGKWECYRVQVLPHPLKNINQAMFIAGSDTRGTAYGVFDISARIGINAWYWWADALPQKKQTLSLNINPFTSITPSVKFRGIFINDEDWGLQPWAAKTFEPGTKDIGPKTYAKVFELLLRLKANLIWPAMHPSTKAFFFYPDNKKIAADYQIVIGSSHAEPMLRNNVGEWDHQTMGDFNYVTNSKNVDAYWESRVKESSNNEVMYTLGMRGVHDSGIEGVKTLKETVPLLEHIISNQRNMLSRNLNRDIIKIPQVFTAYKEVLEIYDQNLKLPEDATVIWPDDNYGYIQRLNSDQENKRSGGSGVYYHTSYWGRPHDYLWLNTSHPGLIREEMTKAYEMNAKNTWVLNVGDIKPAEYNIQLFMDMAYHIEPFKNADYSKIHLTNWLADIFKKTNTGNSIKATQLSAILWNYYQLALERKPEFMGWSQTEPTGPVNFTAYNHQFYGDQAQRRIDAYDQLIKQTKSVGTQLNKMSQASFYQLVYYPVICASLMNQKFLYRDKAFLYAKQGRLIARYYAQLSEQAYQQIIKETTYYNEGLLSGKWANMMSMNPRNLPVFQKPALDITIAAKQNAWQAITEGYLSTDSVNMALAKPLALSFSNQNSKKQFIDLFLSKDTIVNYTLKATKEWINLSKTSGKLAPAGNKSQQRIWVNIDWSKAPHDTDLSGKILITSANKTFTIHIEAKKNPFLLPAGYKGFVENQGYVSIYAQNYTSSTTLKEQHWATIAGLGYTGKSVEALPLKSTVAFKANEPDQVIKKQPSLSYDFYSWSTSPAEIKIYTVPTYPLNKNYEMRYAVSIDNDPATVLNFKTVGRSEEWKQNVLSNSALRSIRLPVLKAGKHELKLYSIDPGVIVDRILIDLGGLRSSYGLIPETREK